MNPKASQDDEAPLSGFERTGRRIGVLFFWLMAIYVVVTSTFSVVTQVYRQPGDPGAGNPQEQACAVRLAALTTRLKDGSANLFSPGAPDPSDWLSAWDRELTALEGRCGRLEATRSRLFDLRGRLGPTLQRLHAGERPRMAQIAGSIEVFTERR